MWAIYIAKQQKRMINTRFLFENHNRDWLGCVQANGSCYRHVTGPAENHCVKLHALRGSCNRKNTLFSKSGKSRNTHVWLCGR